MKQRGALALLLSACAATAAPTWLEHLPEGLVRATGTVQENRRDCVRDAACYLVLAPAVDGPVRVTYHHGEGGAACDPVLVRRAFALERGGHVTVTGRYSRTGPLHAIDLCTPAGSLRTSSHAPAPASSSNADDGSGTSPCCVTMAE